MASSDLLLPEGSVLLHIGPYKTGSTAIQYALHEQRAVLRAHGVLYPGTHHRQNRPGWAVLGTTPRGRKHAEEPEWTGLVEEVRSATLPRVCVSTEDFARAGARKVERIVGDLGPERLHVVAVARRLDRLLPSQWQERIKTCRETKSYQDWLDVVLDESAHDASAKAFWASHDLRAMLDRWLAVLPPERITVIATDDSDHGLLPRTFEAMLGLPSHLLDRTDTANTSLTEEKVEVLRRVNAEFAAQGWPDRAYLRMIQRGARAGLAQAPPSAFDVRIPPLTRSAMERVAELSTDRIDALKNSGVHVVGDLECLRVQPPAAAADDQPTAPGAVSVEAAAQAIEGAVRGALELAEEQGRRHGRELRRVRRQGRDRQVAGLDQVSTRALARVLAVRCRDAVRRRIASARS